MFAAADRILIGPLTWRPVCRVVGKQWAAHMTPEYAHRPEMFGLAPWILGYHGNQAGFTCDSGFECCSGLLGDFPSVQCWLKVAKMYDCLEELTPCDTANEHERRFITVWWLTA